jgi:cytochrome c-type biogenesis protein CcmH/NrfF
MLRSTYKFAAVALLALSSAALVFGQTEAQIQGDEVKRVGTQLSCQCGSCTENVDCNMSSGQCHFCKPARTKIYQMQSQGMSDSAIIASFVSEYGQKIFRAGPNSFFWLIPYLSLAAGVIVIWLILRKVKGGGGGGTLRHATAGGPPIDDDPTLARYRDTIEKDLAKLE